MQIALDLERVEAAARQGTVTTAQIQKILSEVSEKVTGDSLEIPAVESYLSSWLESVVVRNAAGTAVKYRLAVERFLLALGPRAKQPVTAITPTHIEEFLTARLHSGVGSATAALDLRILRAAFKRAELYGLILKSPAAAVRPPKIESIEREVFTPEEVEKLLEAAPSLDWQTLIVLGYFVGARLGDCQRMCWENVRPEEGVLVYQQKKTGRKVVIPIHHHLVEHLMHLSQYGTTGSLCPTLAQKPNGGKYGTSESFRRIARRADVDLMIVETKAKRNIARRTFHSLRHSFNSALANAGVPEDVRMKLTGHASKMVHTKYTHLELETLRNAVRKLPSLGLASDPDPAHSAQIASQPALSAASD
ncbi:MAG: tyrosine-type recombinase/integrase [Limisphaerales bacterium]